MNRRTFLKGLAVTMVAAFVPMPKIEPKPVTTQYMRAYDNYERAHAAWIAKHSVVQDFQTLKALAGVQ